MACNSFYLFSALIVLVCQQIIGNNALPGAAEVYWNNKLVNVPVPEGIRKLLVTDMHDFHFWHTTGPANPGGDGNPKYEQAAELVETDNKNLTTYFLLEDFLPGMKLRIPGPKPTNKAKILPRQVANSFPFSSQHLPKILKKFFIWPDSPQVKNIKKVLESCETKLKIEQRKCVTSLEDMVDFGLAHTGENVGVFQNDIEGESASGVKEFTIIRTKMIGKKVVVCHKEVYPYAVYYCHSLEGTTALTASVLGRRQKLHEDKVLVACHSKTSTWNPNHLAFQVLKIKPGEGTVCHVIGNNNIVWASP
ncbi:unnamed protein product [Cuscuta epithymum]|uniref:BURP domain-containing protein n=1 Tax=Cuscuta epithymum TaxID=186058 RepID=A0AAV0C6J2_9ASTE|nr:unnamed protein product [Cuscuta epithymum]